MDDLDTTTPRLGVAVSKDDDGHPVVTLSGELDMDTAGELEAAVAPTIQSSPARLTVDVAGLSFADSSAIALWVRWANEVPDVEIRQASELLRRVIERMGLTERLKVTE